MRCRDLSALSRAVSYTHLAIRRAMNIGIDREEMIKNVLNGHGTAAYSVCDKMPWYNEESEVTYDQRCV